MKSCYHKSNLGQFGESLPCDLDGYVHLTAAGWADAPMDWADDKPEGDALAEWAREKAREAVRATADADAALYLWQQAQAD